MVHFGIISHLSDIEVYSLLLYTVSIGMLSVGLMTWKLALQLSSSDWMKPTKDAITVHTY